MKYISLIKDKSFAIWGYLCKDVWSDTRDDWRIRFIKTINLSVRSFLDSDLQSRAAGLTYRTLLALVPALAILFAIGRGFGFHKLLQTQIFSYIPAQREALETTFGFVEAYLAQSSEGIFVGIGIVMLLWTMISLMNNIESTFNTIWGIKRGRNILRKITDYTSMLLILPVLMICASGLSIFMTSTLQNTFDFEFMSPLLSFLFKFASYAFTWLFFAAMFMLIPNTKVKFKNALIAGIFSGTGFLILQWLFVSGQLYVSKYNAIYGSFSFLPLLLIWIHFSWVVILSGIVVCYSSQSIYRFNFSNKINEISNDYRNKITLAIMSVIVKQFAQGHKPITIDDLTNRYNFPPRIAMEITEELIEADIVSRVIIEDDDNTEPGFQPAIDINKLSVAYVLNKLDNHGASGFVPQFDDNFSTINNILDNIEGAISQSTDNQLIKDIDINLNNK
ncbi:MAG: YihY/virulence factor BrkB family protein [Muribaculaceae bacterium]|nr:YihY/virulence factor BrkB family protein [Muribaculaceae bacterium]